MYLIEVIRVKQGDEIHYLPKIEEISAFQYQLRSDSLSVLDCESKSGHDFEVHYGKDSLDHGPCAEDCVTFAVAIAPDSERAIKCACMLSMDCQPSPDDFIPVSDECEDFNKMPVGCVLMWHGASNDFGADTFWLKQ